MMGCWRRTPSAHHSFSVHPSAVNCGTRYAVSRQSSVVSRHCGTLYAVSRQSSAVIVVHSTPSAISRPSSAVNCCVRYTVSRQSSAVHRTLSIQPDLILIYIKESVAGQVVICFWNDFDPFIKFKEPLPTATEQAFCKVRFEIGVCF